MSEKIIKADEIVGKITSDLIPNNVIEKVEWEENKIFIVFSHTSDTPITMINANSDDIFFASMKVDSSNPFADYNGEIVTSSSGRIAFFNIISAKNNKYYDVVYDSEPFCALNDITNNKIIGGEMRRVPFGSLSEFKEYILGINSQYFTHEYGYLDTKENSYNDKLSNVNILAAVNIDKTTEFQMLIGCSAELYSVQIDSFSKVKGGENNIFNLATNELFCDTTTINNTPIGEVIADKIFTAYAKGKQTITFSVVANPELYKVGDIVIPYGFNNEPIALDLSGKAKRFRITSAELAVKGGARQNLEMVETLEYG